MEPPSLGRHDLCFSVNDVQLSYDFYTYLGFHKVEGDLKEKWIVVAHRNLRIGLYQEHITDTILNFRGGDVSKINKFVQLEKFSIKLPYKEAEKGGGNLTILDPNDNKIFFDTHHSELKIPEQLEAYVKESQNGDIGIGDGIIVLTVKNSKALTEFYTKLGFTIQENIL